tara:strand:- start:148 stop:516 length:369 start_codon:yes stop_codon:yes gene_type:complete
MASLAVRLPITRNTTDGFTMIKDFNTLVKQNLKMLILTAPGERIMEPLFGVGARQYLFQNFGEQTYGDMSANIRNQVKEFMPAVSILQIDFNTSNPDRNTLGVRIVYSIPDIGVKDLLEFTI